jgi:hypothetical protein
MTITPTRSVEPLYIVIVREKNAQQLLIEWAKSNNAQVSIDTNRMKIFDNRAYSLFQVSWPHNWDNVLVWDCWLKRHIYSN